MRPDYLTHQVTNIIKNSLTFVPLIHESFYTCLLQKTWIGFGLTDKQRGIKTIRMFNYKKGFIYTEQQLPYLQLDMYLCIFRERHFRFR